HRDVVEGVRTATALATSDLDLVAHPASVPGTAGGLRTVAGGCRWLVASSAARTRGKESGMDDTAWTGGPLLGFDTETTGVDVHTDRIVTAAVVLRTATTTDVRTWMIDPGVEIPAEAAAIHGVTTEHARAHGVPPRQALAEIAAVLAEHTRAGVPVVAYNAAFDLTLLDAELARH